MLTCLLGVVDPRFKIYGLTNVRVVDASVIPLTTGVAIQSTVYAIAEKVGPHLDWVTLARSDLAASLGRRYTQKRVGSRVGRIRSPFRSDINPRTTSSLGNEEELLYFCCQLVVNASENQEHNL